MRALQRSGLFAIIILLAVLLAACSGMTDQGTMGTTATTTTQNMNKGTSSAKTTPTATGKMNNGNSMQGITITQDTTGDVMAAIRTGKAMIDGKEMSVLTTTKGFAVYYYKADPAFKSTCTGQCAKDWPPVLAPQSMTVTSSVLLPKQLSLQRTLNGNQIFYDGHALYTYAEDKQADQAMGYGEDMQWYLADTMMMTMTTTGGQMNNPTPVATTTSMNNGNMDNGSMNNGNTMQGLAITASTTGNMAAFIHTGQVVITGIHVNVLTTNQGFAIYYYQDDTAFMSTCTGQCAKDWPPVLAPQGMMTVTSSVTLPKQLSVHQTANGAQVFYDGHALYTYAQDKQAGRATGRGEDMKWYLVGFQL
jgi:predicted lipoprotein with Yx(FWY)xxD motif